MYRGLNDLNLTTETLELFVADNEAVQEEQEVIEDVHNQAVAEINIDDEENWLFGTFRTQQPESQPSQSLLTPQTPLQAEVARYMSHRDLAERPEAGIQTFDTLG